MPQALHRSVTVLLAGLLAIPAAACSAAGTSSSPDPASSSGNGSSAGSGSSGAPSGGSHSSGPPTGGGSSAGPPTGGGSSSGGQSSGGSAAGGDGATASPAGLPARIRRLTNAEYDASVRALLGVTRSPTVELSFPPDSKQGPSNSPAGAAFTVNDAQRVDPVLAMKLDAAAQLVIAEARTNGTLSNLAPCADTSTAGGESCARAFIQSFGTKAYRRVLKDEEIAGLLRTYHVGADGFTYAEGIDLVTRVLLQSPGFLYATELGGDGVGPLFELTASETAASLSYLLTSGPPDDALLALAATDALSQPDVRESEARRLIATAAGRERFVRVVREWLGIDQVARREKSQGVYPEFASVSQSMEDESRAFIDEVLSNSTGTLAELLTADWTVVDQPLATLYGVTAAGPGQRTSLAAVKRRGILNQGAFLSVFATNSGSHPVFRGVAILRRIACLDVPDPSAAGLVVTFPATDDSKTTRGRFDAHAAGPSCAGCHALTDGFGFAFEGFDGIGRARDTENGLPVDTQVTIEAGTDMDSTYPDSAALVAALAGSHDVRACLARQIFRSTAARSDASVKEAEDAFIGVWNQLPVDQQGRLADVLTAFVKSPMFTLRRTP